MAISIDLLNCLDALWDRSGSAVGAMAGALILFLFSARIYIRNSKVSEFIL
jgi:hypothetical protein